MRSMSAATWFYFLEERVGAFLQLTAPCCKLRWQKNSHDGPLNLITLSPYF
jgi:hypothetical protein